MRHLTLFLAAFYLLFSTSVSAKQDIFWVKWALVPEYVESGDHKGTGYLDEFLRYVQKRLPEYEHQEGFQTLNRISRSWSKGNVCSLHLWLGYWPDKIVYSRPYAFTPRFGVVTKKGSSFYQDYIGTESLSLKQLLANTNYSLGILPLFYVGSKDSRYPLLAPIIEPYLKTSKVREFLNNKNEMNVGYLERGRADYIIRQRITHHSEIITTGIQDNYQYFSLDEGKRHKLVASACSNSALGNEVISKINGFIDDEFYLKYIELRQKWDPNNSSFNQTYLDYFIEGKHNPYVTE